MIKVFLVEDEIVIRSAIKSSIDWEKEGYEFAGRPVTESWHIL